MNDTFTLVQCVHSICRTCCRSNQIKSKIRSNGKRKMRGINFTFWCAMHVFSCYSFYIYFLFIYHKRKVSFPSKSHLQYSYWFTVFVVMERSRMRQLEIYNSNVHYCKWSSYFVVLCCVQQPNDNEYRI